MNPPVLEIVKSPWQIRDGVSLDRGSIRLNLGGAGEGFRDGRIPGFYTVDMRDVPDTDILSDVSDLGFCPINSVEEIYSSNVLEHFPHKETANVLREWHRVLKPGGKLWLSVPDFDACVRLYTTHGLVPWVQYLIWGDQEHPLNYHYVNFTFASLAIEAFKAGFTDIKRVEKLPYSVEDASTLRDNVDHLPISLNVEVTK